VEGLIDKSSGNLPGASLLEIARNTNYKVPINKLIIGKPVLRSDSGTGYMLPEIIAKSVDRAMSETAKDPSGQWKAGIMGWQV